MERKKILEMAMKCVCGDREQDYGTPEDSFQVIADFWYTYLSARCAICDLELSADDVAAMMALFKIARIATGHGKADNWIDLAGYAACGGEIQGGEQ